MSKDVQFLSIITLISNILLTKNVFDDTFSQGCTLKVSSVVQMACDHPMFWSYARCFQWFGLAMTGRVSCSTCPTGKPMLGKIVKAKGSKSSSSIWLSSCFIQKQKYATFQPCLGKIISSPCPNFTVGVRHSVL